MKLIIHFSNLLKLQNSQVKKINSNNNNESNIAKGFITKSIPVSNILNKSAFYSRDKSKPLPIIIAPKSFIPSSDKSMNNFISFQDLVDNIGETFKEFENDEFLDQNPTSKNIVKQQLQFNKKQEQKFIDDTNQTSLNLYNTLMESIKVKEKKEKHMPIIKILPSRPKHNKYFSKSSYKNENDDSSNESNVLSTNGGFIFQNNYHLHWHQINEANIWKPEVREGATLVIKDRYGYLYGGLGQSLIEDMLILDTRKSKYLSID